MASSSGSQNEELASPSREKRAWMLRASGTIRASEAFYFTEMLREWFERTHSSLYLAVQFRKSKQGSVTSPGRVSPSPVETIRKSFEKLRDKAKQGTIFDLTNLEPDPTGLRDKLQNIGKYELMNLVIKYHNQMDDLGLSAENNLILESVLTKKRSSEAAKLQRAPVTGIDKLLEDGLLAFLMKLNKHLPPLAPQVIKFKDITYTAQVAGATQGYETVGSVFLKCLLPCFTKRKAAQKFTVLENCSGYLMPGTLTLVCGPPGCDGFPGKSSLHKALAGRLFVDKSTRLRGKVTYNGKGLEDFKVRRVATFIAQTDRHLPTLTVRETCEFAYACTSNFKKTAIKVTDEAGIVETELGGENLPLELTLHLLGLRGPADTIVGNTTTRGVSGGERHRVTTAEMVSGTFLVYFLDEISTGLDSSATYDIVCAFRTMARIRRYTCLFSLLQPSPEVFDLFDRVIVLNEGRIIYQGPREDLLPYFADLGYMKPSHVDVADFLQEVTTEEGVRFLQPGCTHLSSNEFVDAYSGSDMHKDVLRVVDSPKNVHELWMEAAKPLGLELRDKEVMAGGKSAIVVSEVEATGMAAVANIQQTTQVKEGDCITGVVNSHGRLEYVAFPESTYIAADIVKNVQEAPGNVRLQLERSLEDASASNVFEHEFVQDWWPSTKTVFKRQATLALRNTSFVLARNLQLLILGAFTGTLFYQVPNTPGRSDMDLRKSLAFLAVMALSLNTVSQIPIQLDERQVFEKQYAARFFRPNAYVLACTLSQIPFTLIEMLIYTPLIYFLTGLSSAHYGLHYVLYVLVVFIEAITFAALVRVLASKCRTKEAASALAGLSIIFFLLFAGFIVTKNKVPPWWIWVYYISPLQWGVTALICNEFLSGKYDQDCSNEISYCLGRDDLKVGQAYLELYQLPTTFFRGYWVPVIILSSYYCILTCLCFYTVANVRHDEVRMPPAARLESSSKPNASAITKCPDTKPVGGSFQDKEGSFLLSKMESGRPDGAAVIVGASRIKFEPMILSFHHITYEVDIPAFREPRVLLSNVSGFAKPRTMTALMGSSGAGKTTLLDVLAGRKTIGRVSGDILINGYPKLQETFARIAGYVEQNNIHTPFITVKESLEFSGALRLPRGTASAQRKQFVKEVMDLLELNDIPNKLVGSIGDAGLSVEEAKRLTIGVELVANPSILFLDEPTSGLDSRAALIVMRGVVNIVGSGRSVICTIHQPNRRLFLYFDQLLLLKHGGEVAYFGPIGPNAQELLNYFHSLPGVQECPVHQNPASYMLEIIGAGIGHTAQRDFALDYQTSSLAQRNMALLHSFKFGKGKIGKEPLTQGYAATWSLMFVVVVKRQFRTYWRNISYSFGRMTVVTVLGLILGSTFWQIKYDTAPGLVSRTGLVYIAVVMVAVSNANNVIPQVNAERMVYYRERASNMYSVFLYNLSWTLAEIPYLCVSTLLFCSICFTMSGIATDSAKDFFQFWFIFFEYSSSITFFGIFLAMLTPNAQVATIIIPIIVNFWNMTSGFMIPKARIPQIWIWLYWLNPTQYTINSLTAIAFYCDTESPPCNTCTLDPASCPDCQCVRVKDEGHLLAWTIMHDQMSLNYEARFKSMGVLFVFNIMFCMAGVIALRFMKFDKR